MRGIIKETFYTTVTKAASVNLLGLSTKNVFISISFHNWMKAFDKFKKHEKSNTHSHAIAQLKALKEKSIVTQLSDKKRPEQVNSRTALLKI